MIYDLNRLCDPAEGGADSAVLEFVVLLNSDLYTH